ncbi:MAG: DUF2946 domain-containing protein [Piscinibacter sp.]|nr:DUF2946 domain-containing protein [Piscinibacter sp.]
MAMLALLLMSLAPAVSHALGGTWTEVCTAQGSKWVRGEAKDAGDAPAALHGLEHCPLCSVHAPVLGLPPAVDLGVPAPETSIGVTPAFLAAPRTLHAWVSALPRAPPRHS